MNGTEQNEKNRRMRPEEILEMFREVVQQHASKSYNFPISNLLEQYIHSRTVPNFPEAAILIDSAGQVYSRKVDYLEALLMAMHDKQNAPDRNEKADNPDQVDNPTTEKKRLPGKRLKNVDHSSTTIQLAPPKHIKKSSSTVEKINLNLSDTSDADKFKNYCQAVKSKIPVFYERVNLLISDKTDTYFDGARAISKDDPDCQKNYNVFVGCISFKEKQMMSQREFLNRIQFDNLDGGSDQTNANAPAAPEDYVHNTDGLSEQPSCVAGGAGSNNDEDLLERLRETSLLLNSTTAHNDECDSAMVDDDASQLSQLNSTAGESTLNNTLPLNSTEQSSLMESSIALDSTINESEVVNSTVNNSQSTDIHSQSDISTINNDTVVETTVNSTLNGTEALDSTQETSKVDETSQTNGTSNDDTLMNSTSFNIDETNQTNGTSNADTLMNSTCADEKSTSDSQLDANGTTSGTINETLETIQNDSACNNVNGLVDSSNIFRIKDEYLKLDEVFRLPLSVLQQEVNIKLNIFGIPFGRLRRQVKFALPKDFDSLRTGIKRTRDFDECSTTTTRKFVKLNDGTATPSIEASSMLPPTVCDQLPDSSIVPAPDTNTAETPPEDSSQPIDGTGLENGISAECSAGENAPNCDELSTTQTTLENPSQLVDGVTQSQDVAAEDLGVSDCFPNDDGPSLPKIPRMSPTPALSIFDSGIGTGTEGSQYDDDADGTITKRRMTLDLTPPSEQIEYEMSAEADEQSANRIQEMTNLSEKVHSWHQRLKPILLHSERRNDFDVKETSRNIVACFKNGDSSLETKAQSDRLISFESIMERRDKADTARYFFSMLQMANNRNIQLIVNHNDSAKLCPQNKIMLKLLNPNIREIDPSIEKN
ncbi:uncharacterized protein LOC119068072 isoform X2 [Bradysia coprophila]|nr:uncharacterized protein LOC119068072 isoform X2 [Bradysia coprophila]XP_037027371.1 uncharacterized protein LOC119068072 isoform X2 [Bradysia coprophila]XP_037027372.1 uncharacterized protein LOC119068072 isoform X2 [Bradysia coprophila]XP_037027373.1 uncharacterized protein LOC119068072 isoform X2 [Bradysia coprophila]